MNLSAPQWLVDWLHGVSLWDALLFLGFAICLVLFIKKKGWRWLIAFAKAILATAQVIDNVKELPAFIESATAEREASERWREAVDTRLEAHTRQLENSHSTNLRDDVTDAVETAKRVEQSVEGMHGRFDSVEAEMKNIRHDMITADDALRIEFQKADPPPSE